MTPTSRLHIVRRLSWLLLLLGLATALHAATPPAFDPVAETEKLLNTMPAEARAKSDAYFEGGYWLAALDQVVTLSFTWGVLQFGLIRKFRDWAENGKTTRRLLAALVFLGVWLGVSLLFKLLLPKQPDWLWMLKFVTSPVVAGLVAFVFLKDRIARWAHRPGLHAYLAAVYFLVLFTLSSWILTMPWGIYVGYLREHDYGLSNLSLGDWFMESIKGQLIFTLFFSVLLALLFQVIRKYPSRWWVIASLVAPAVLFVGAVISPVFIAPVFNSYQPLQNQAVLQPILSMARANGVPADNVYEFDASKQSKRISANVSGAFGTIRVSLNDNLLNRCTPAEVQAVMGHELGHYVLNHVYKLVIYLSLVTAATFAFTHWFLGVACRRWGPRWDVRGPADLAAIPLFWLGMSLAMYLATPVQNSIVRTTESEADIFGLNAARQPDGFATTALKLSEYRKLAPGKWEEIIFFDHPSGYNRILMAMRWKAEHLAEPQPVAPGR